MLDGDRVWPNEPVRSSPGVLVWPDVRGVRVRPCDVPCEMRSEKRVPPRPASLRGVRLPRTVASDVPGLRGATTLERGVRESELRSDKDGLRLTDPPRETLEPVRSNVRGDREPPSGDANDRLPKELPREPDAELRGLNPELLCGRLKELPEDGRRPNEPSPERLMPDEDPKPPDGRDNPGVDREKLGVDLEKSGEERPKPDDLERLGPDRLNPGEREKLGADRLNPELPGLRPVNPPRLPPEKLRPPPENPPRPPEDPPRDPPPPLLRWAASAGIARAAIKNDTEIQMIFWDMVLLPGRGQ